MKVSGLEGYIIFVTSLLGILFLVEFKFSLLLLKLKFYNNLPIFFGNYNCWRTFFLSFFLLIVII